MSESTLLPKNVNVSKLRYSEVKSLSNGSKTVYINYGSDKLTIQTPLMSIPSYGIGDGTYKDKDGKEVKQEGGKKYDVSVSFRGMDDNPKIQAFHDKMQEIERKIKEDAFNNRLTWLRDDFDGMKGFTDKMFSPFIKYSKDKDTGKISTAYPPTLRLKLPYNNESDTFTFDAYDMDENEIDFKSIMYKLNGAKTQLVIQLSGIWFAGGKYGCTWKVLMGKFQMARKNKVTFIADSDDEDTRPSSSKKFEDDEDLEEDALAMAAASSPQNTGANDDEEDDDDIPPPPVGALSLKDNDDDNDDDDMPPPPPSKRGAAPKKTTSTKK
jgi:hypothetical protein